LLRPRYWYCCWCPYSAAPGREAQSVEAVSDELKALKVNGFTEGEATTQQTFTVSSDDEHPSERPEEKRAANALPDTTSVDIFCIDKIKGGQDRAF
jgi:hypothetical protein